MTFPLAQTCRRILVTLPLIWATSSFAQNVLPSAPTEVIRLGQPQSVTQVPRSDLPPDIADTTVQPDVPAARSPLTVNAAPLQISVFEPLEVRPPVLVIAVHEPLEVRAPALTIQVHEPLEITPPPLTINVFAPTTSRAPDLVVVVEPDGDSDQPLLGLSKTPIGSPLCAGQYSLHSGLAKGRGYGSARMPLGTPVMDVAELSTDDCGATLKMRATGQMVVLSRQAATPETPEGMTPYLGSLKLPDGVNRTLRLVCGPDAMMWGTLIADDNRAALKRSIWLIPTSDPTPSHPNCAK